ncbi:glycosyl transferase family 1 [Leifsonia sp. LS1]|uniref:glycosyltransferase family 4 protein n=1 Tax=Leifsonia sp. LS1 TaxID=2828483 RepID=UPI001CFE1214|nr:glycosyltransferase family 1 protein [Leifsonia sp. LS1]GIT81032.1 glycosyl transferase family 1 [Leifsonia sp. LS1]
MPRVLVDLLFFTGTKGGMESYVERMYSAMPEGTGFDFTALISREAESMDLSWFPGDVLPSGVSGENRVAWAVGEIRNVARAARRIGADLIHSPANLGPIRTSVPLVLTVHDVLPFVHPEWVPGRYGAALRWLIRRAAKAATRLVTISEASAADITRELGVPRDRIDIVPLSGDDDVAPSGSPAAAERPLALMIGNRMPHKNGETLVRALAALEPDRRPRLAITGGVAGRDPLRELATDLGIEPDIDFVGWVSPGELEDLFRQSSFVAFPTRFEGFGIPVLEAMARGRAVVCSDIPVLHEVAGDAAVYLPPTDTAAWAEALAELPWNRTRLHALESAGVERAREFSWQRTAGGVLDAFQRALAER